MLILLLKSKWRKFILMMFFIVTVNAQNTFHDTPADNIGNGVHNRVVVHPNPASHEISVSGVQGHFIIRVYDAYGRERLFGMRPEGDREPFDILFLSPGIYFYQIKTANDAVFNGSFAVVRPP